MKKSLIALAALSAFATAAQAQSSVTIYGIIDTGYNSIENTTSAGVKTDNKLVQGPTPAATGEASSSRLGFRGTEDLGGGLKANFIAESNMRANTALSFDRALWVGLEDAKMGQLRVGLQDSTVRSNWLAHDQLAAANVVGNLAHNQVGVANGTGASNAAAGSHSALNTAINYLSPRINGVQLTLGVTQNDSQEGTANKQKTGSGSQAGLNYVAGKFSAGVAYVESTTSVNAVDATGYFLSQTAGANLTRPTSTLGAAAVAAQNTKNKETSAAASYDLGVAKVAYIYNKRDSQNSAAATDWATNIDRTSHSFSASVPVGAKTVLRAGYGFGELRQGATSNYNADIKGMQAAVNYNLSKRTTVYGIYGDESREITASTKAKTKEYSVGVRHSF